MYKVNKSIYTMSPIQITNYFNKSKFHALFLSDGNMFAEEECKLEYLGPCEYNEHEIKISISAGNVPSFYDEVVIIDDDNKEVIKLLYQGSYQFIRGYGVYEKTIQI